MQNKGIVIVTAVLLTLASIFYLSFSFATSYYDKQAAELKDPIAQQNYKDSVKYLGIYSYQKCLETQIGLGLDLKGGMNVILEISVPDVIETLADHKSNAAFLKSLEEAKKEEETSQSDFISLFIKYYKQNAPGHQLAELFATQQLQGKVSPQSSDSQVEKVLKWVMEVKRFYIMLFTLNQQKESLLVLLPFKTVLKWKFLQRLKAFTKRQPSYKVKNTIIMVLRLQFLG